MGEPETVHELMTLANKAASAEEALQFVKDRDQGIQRPQPGLNAGPTNKKRKNRPTRTGGGKKAKAEEVMANVPDKRSGPTRGQRKKSDAPEGSGKVWCEIHRTDNHSLDQCRIFKKHLQAEVEKLRGKQVANQDRDSSSNSEPGAFPSSDRHVDHIFGGSASYESNRHYKTVAREVLASVP